MRPPRQGTDMRAFDHSVSFTLRTLMGLLIVAMVAVTAVFVVSGGQNYLQSARMVRLVEADRALFEALNKMRLNRGVVQTALLAEDDPTATIRSRQDETQQKLDQAVATIAAVDLADKGEIIDAVRS